MKMTTMTMMETMMMAVTTSTAVTATYENQVAVETTEDRRNRNEAGWSPTLSTHNASSLLFLVESWNTEVAREHCITETARPDRSRGFEDIASIMLDLYNSVWEINDSKNSAEKCNCYLARNDSEKRAFNLYSVSWID